MIDNILLLPFVIFVILMIMDVITTEYALKNGGYEKSEVLRFIAGKPKLHIIVKIGEIVFVFSFLQFVVMFTSGYSTLINMIFLIFLDLVLAYTQLNNVKVIWDLKVVSD